MDTLPKEKRTSTNLPKAHIFTDILSSVGLGGGAGKIKTDA